MLNETMVNKAIITIKAKNIGDIYDMHIDNGIQDDKSQKKKKITLFRRSIYGLY